MQRRPRVVTEFRVGSNLEHTVRVFVFLDEFRLESGIAVHLVLTRIGDVL